MSRLVTKFVLAGVCAIGAFAAPASAQNLKFAAFVSDTERAYLDVMKPFVENVNREAEGVIKIDLFPNGTLGRNPAQQAQMVLDGVADIAWVVASYTPGRFRENEVLQLPGVFRDLNEATAISSKLVSDGLIKDFDDYFVIGFFGSEPYSIHSRKPVKSLADVKGQKFRSSAALEASALRGLDAVPVSISITELPEAISRGTVDGTTMYASALFDFGLDRVTSHHYRMGVGTVPLAILMNRKKFDSLPDKAKAVIRKYSGKWTADRYSSEVTRYNDEMWKRLSTDPKRTVVVPSAADAARASAVFKTVTTEWAARSPRNKELLGILERELSAYRQSHK